MRIISQNGTVDVPYELTSIQLVSKTTIVAQGSYFGSSSNDNFVTVAEYSTEAKAQKAMNMLRDAYLSRMELDGGYDTVHGCYIQPNYWVLPKVFQFPQDEDVEV